MARNQYYTEGQQAAISNIRIAFFLNFGFTIMEIIGGMLTNSVAIISDALHDLGDSLSLGLSWYFQKLSNKKRDKRFSFGYKRFSLLAAIINSLILIIGSIFVLNETIPRLFAPETTSAKGMLILAVFGIIINGIAVFKLKKGTSLNEKVVYLHLLEDVLGWVAILITSIVMIFTKLSILDPVLSVLITSYVLFNVLKNLKSGFLIFLQAIPTEIETKKIETQIKNLPKVRGVHDLHIWTMDGKYNVLTIHIVLKSIADFNEIKTIKHKAKAILKELNIQHATVEIDMEDENCELENCST